MAQVPTLRIVIDQHQQQHGSTIITESVVDDAIRRDVQPDFQFEGTDTDPDDQIDVRLVLDARHLGGSFSTLTEIDELFRLMIARGFSVVYFEVTTPKSRMVIDLTLVASSIQTFHVIVLSEISSNIVVASNAPLVGLYRVQVDSPSLNMIDWPSRNMSPALRWVDLRQSRLSMLFPPSPETLRRREEISTTQANMHWGMTSLPDVFLSYGVELQVTPDMHDVIRLLQRYVRRREFDQRLLTLVLADRRRRQQQGQLHPPDELYRMTSDDYKDTGASRRVCVG